MILWNTETTLAEVGSSGSTAKKLTLTSWNGRPAKLDLRTWRTDENGQQQPGKGLTLTDTEAAALAQALAAYLKLPSAY